MIARSRTRPTIARLSSIAPALLLAAIAAVVLYRSPYRASNLEIDPDSVEYALGAHRFVSEGDYQIVIEGQRLPPRYPPWFSLLAIAPAYWILGSEVGNAIVPVTIFAVAGIVLAFAVGRRIGSDWGGALAALATLSLPDYRLWGRLVMTDVPSAVLIVALCLLYLNILSSGKHTAGRYLAAGLLTALGASFRPIHGVALLPFLLSALSIPGPSAKLRRIALLAFPLGVLAAAGLAYNSTVFGTPFRNGYQFWCPVPYDYPRLTWSASYLTTNLSVIRFSKLELLVPAAIAVLYANRLLGRRRPGIAPASTPGLRVGAFLLLATGPVVVFHLVYFYPDSRFYLASAALAAIVVGGVVGGWLGRLPRATLLAGLAMVLVAVCVDRGRRPQPAPERRIAADNVVRYTPADAIVISGIPPVYLQYLAGKDSAREVLPISRRTEYANKLIARKKIPNPTPSPRDWHDHRCQGLLNAGAEEGVPRVASEQIDWLAGEASRGRRVFIEAKFLEEPDLIVLNEIEKRFRVVSVSDDIFELAAR